MLTLTFSLSEKQSNCTETSSMNNITVKKNISMVFVRRMRKAGSTSIFKGYQDHYRPLFVEGDEQTRFNIPCFSHPFARHVLFITHLREPMSRIKSEFYYMGPGGKHSNYQLNIDSVWNQWIKESHIRLYEEGGNHSGMIHGGTLIDNLYIRALTGNCGKCIINEKGHIGGCTLTGRHGKLPRLKSINKLDYLNAQSVLEKFDIVIIIELLKDDKYMDLIRYMSSNSNSSLNSNSNSENKQLVFGHSRLDKKAHTEDSDIPSKVMNSLKTENHYDISLYLKWKLKIKCQLEIFKKEEIDHKDITPS